MDEPEEGAEVPTAEEKRMEASAADAMEAASRAVGNAAAVTETHNLFEDERWNNLTVQKSPKEPRNIQQRKPQFSLGLYSENLCGGGG